MQHRFAPTLSAMLAGAALVAGSLAGFGQVAVAGAQPVYPPGPSVAAFPPGPSVAAFPPAPLDLNPQPEPPGFNPQPDPPGATYPPGPTVDGIIPKCSGGD